jgi:hypothetical protein
MNNVAARTQQINGQIRRIVKNRGTANSRERRQALQLRKTNLEQQKKTLRDVLHTQKQTLQHKQQQLSMTSEEFITQQLLKYNSE